MITDWNQLPVVMKPAHVAALLGVAEVTIWKRCRAKTMRPTPVSWEKPWEWDRETVRAQYAAGVTRIPIGRPGAQKKRRRPLQRATEAFAAHPSTP